MSGKIILLITEKEKAFYYSNVESLFYILFNVDAY